MVGTTLLIAFPHTGRVCLDMYRIAAEYYLKSYEEALRLGHDPCCNMEHMFLVRECMTNARGRPDNSQVPIGLPPNTSFVVMNEDIGMFVSDVFGVLPGVYVLFRRIVSLSGCLPMILPLRSLFLLPLLPVVPLRWMLCWRSRLRTRVLVPLRMVQMGGPLLLRTMIPIGSMSQRPS